MFRIISEKFDPSNAPIRPGSGAIVNEAIPFVEIGGPEGFVTSIAPPAPTKAATRPQPPVQAPPVAPIQSEAPKPAPVARPEYLSVQFHSSTVPAAAGSGIAAELVAHHEPNHSISAEYRQVRDEIRHQHRAIGPKVFFFTSARPESGTTTVLLNFAITLAAEPESKVVILDADFDSPTIARKLAAADHHGLTDVLGNSVPLAWAVQPTAIPRLHVVPTGTSELRPAAITDLPRIITQLKQSFDWVLIDAGRWGVMSDRDGVSSSADAVYAVTRSTDLERLEFTGLRSSISHAGGTLRGYITTRT
ncbi:MAG: hypothetical protein U0798_02270 [Gemmataceae bacterium]